MSFSHGGSMNMVPPSTIIAFSLGKRSNTPPQIMKVSGRYSHHMTSET